MSHLVRLGLGMALAIATATAQAGNLGIDLVSDSVSRTVKYGGSTSST